MKYLKYLFLCSLSLIIVFSFSSEAYSAGINSYRIAASSLKTSALDLVIKDNYAYVVEGNSGDTTGAYFEVFNIANPLSPVKVNLTKNLTFSGGTWGVFWGSAAISGNYLYVVWTNGDRSLLGIYNISDPNNPVLSGELPIPAGHSYSVSLYQPYAYVTGGNGADIIDISNPATPTLVKKISGIGTSIISGNYLYASPVSGGFLNIYSLSDPLNPVLTGSAPIASALTGITIVGNVAYVGTSATGQELEIFDVTNKAAPIKLAGHDYAPDLNLHYLAVDGAYAYAPYDGGVYKIFNISNPAAPTIVATGPMSGYGIRALVYGQYVVIASGWGGGGGGGYLNIYGPQTIPIVISPTATSIKGTVATLGANVTSNGGASLTEIGTCWGTTPAPLTNCLPQGGVGTSVFTHSRIGLPSGTTIYYRGYAVNSVGTGYSSDGTFTTLAGADVVSKNLTATGELSTGSVLTFSAQAMNQGASDVEPLWSKVGGGGLNGSWPNGEFESAFDTVMHNGKVYIGLGANPGDAEVWEYDGTLWTKIGGDGIRGSWPDLSYELVFALTSFNGKLYASLGTGFGDAEVWEYDGTTWTQVGGDGVRGSWSSRSWGGSLYTDGLKLYAGTGPCDNCADVWEYDGTAWTQIGGVAVGSNFGGGEVIDTMMTYQNELYIGVDVDVWSAEVWKWNGSVWTKVGGDGVNGSWSDADGNDWPREFVVFNNKLYLGLGSGTGEGELWQWNGSVWTKVGGDGVNGSWAASKYEWVRSVVVYDNELYAGLGSSSGDAELWKWNESTWMQVGGDGINGTWLPTLGSVFSLTTDTSDLYAAVVGSGSVVELWKYSISNRVRFCIGDPNCLTSATSEIGNAEIDSLPAGATSPVASTTWTATVGTHTVYFCVDVDAVIPESNETNNCSSATFLIAAPGSPDIVPENLTVSGELTTGSVLTFSADTKNVGTVAMSTSNTFKYREIGRNYATDNDQAYIRAALNGNYVYVTSRAIGTDLDVFDLSNPYSISRVGGIDFMTTNSSGGIEINGNYAYVTSSSLTEGDRFSIFDITNASTPALIKKVPIVGGNNFTNGMAIKGNYAYVTSWHPDKDIEIIDITNPNSASVVSRLDHPQNESFTDVAISGNYMFVVGSADDFNDGINPAEFWVYDISNPLNPISVTNLELYQSLGIDGGSYSNFGPNAINIYGSHAYVGSDDSLITIDISNPLNPQEVSRILTDRINALVIHSESIHIVQEFDGIYSYNLSNPASPTREGTIATRDSFDANANRYYDIAFSSTNAYVTRYTTVSGTYGYLSVHEPRVYTRFCIDNPNCLTSTTGRVGGSDFGFGTLSVNASFATSTTYIVPATMTGLHTLYYCTDVVSGYDSVTESNESNNCTSRTFTIASLPNLVSQNLPLFTGTYYQGTSIALTAQVRNSGMVSTGVGFSDNFSYQWNGTGGTWTNLPNITKSALAAGGTSNDSGTYTPNQAGTLYIQHCVDSLNQIAEGINETPNCTMSGPITVNSRTSFLDAVPSTIVSGQSSTLTWGSTGYTSCAVLGQSFPAGITGSGNVSPLVTTPYILQCDGVNQTPAVVTVNALPTLTASHRIVTTGDPITLTWDLNGQTGCSLTGGALGTTYNTVPVDTGTTGPQTITAKTKYTLTCPVGSPTVTVEIVPMGFET